MGIRLNNLKITIMLLPSKTSISFLKDRPKNFTSPSIAHWHESKMNYKETFPSIPINHIILAIPFHHEFVLLNSIAIEPVKQPLKSFFLQLNNSY